MAYNKKEKLISNIEALRTAFSFAGTNESPTIQQLDVMSAFSGFGGLPCVLRPVDRKEDINKWPVSERNLFPLVEEFYSLLRENSEDEATYERYVHSIRSSTLTSFYTPSPIVSALGRVLEDFLPEVNRYLDPSAGTGIFSRNMWARFNTECVAFEKELLTGTILSLLQPGAEVHMEGFEKIDSRYENHFDLIASNIPFGNIAVFDPAFSQQKDKIRQQGSKIIHNYFFMKSVDLLREGGVMALITSQGMMDSPENKPIRRWLMDRCDLISAVRLPHNLFKEEAGTQVGTDLVILQKNSQKQGLSQRELAFTNCRKLKNGAYINNYYRDYGRVLHTESEVGRDGYGDPAFLFYHSGTYDQMADDLEYMLREDLYQYLVTARYTRNLFREKAGEEEIIEPPAGNLSYASNLNLWELFQMAPEEREKVKQSGKKKETGAAEKKPDATRSSSRKIRLFEGKVFPWFKAEMLVEDKGEIGYILPSAGKGVHFQPLDMAADQQERVLAYLRVRNAYIALVTIEKHTGKENYLLRRDLNEYYDRFTHLYGDLTNKNNFAFISLDSFGEEVLSLESFVDGQKQRSEIFERPVSFSTDSLKATTATEALAVSLNKIGKVSLEFMATLYPKTEKEILKELTDRIHYNPLSGEFELREKIISGNVIQKREAFEAYLKENPEDPRLDAILETLHALIRETPEPIPYEDIDFNFGERWIPLSYFEEYTSGLFNTKISLAYDSFHDLFGVAAQDETEEIRSIYAVKGENRLWKGTYLLVHALQDTLPSFKKTVTNELKEEIKIPDHEANQLAERHILTIREGFTSWLNDLSRERQEELAALYNRRFKARVSPEFDGSFLTFPGLELDKLDIPSLRSCQKNAAFKLLINDGGLVDHEVGLGKTLTICITAHEMVRLKMTVKPLVLCLKANVEAIADDYRKAYPHAKVLAPAERDFYPRNRKKLFHRIKNDYWDAIFITHDQFMMIPQPLRTIEQVLNGEMKDVERNLRVFEESTNESACTRLLKGLERSLKNQQAKLEELQFQINKRKDDTHDFETLGFGHIFVDESHYFKNLLFATRHGYISGLGNPQGSQKALNLLYAIRTLQNRKDKDLCATFLSGTMLSNSLAELYLLFKYLCPRMLEEQGIPSFDAWAAVYARKSTEYEFSVVNEVIRKERFRYFIKVPELAGNYHEITHFRTADEEGIDRPRVKEILHTIPQTPDQKEFIERIKEFAQTGDLSVLDIPSMVSEDNAAKARGLLATNYGKKMTLDMRLIDPKRYGDDPGNKISYAAREVHRLYHEFNKHKATQFIFCDLGVPKENEWNVYQALKDKLVNEYDIPSHEIAFIQDYKQDEKNDLIKAINKGSIRILFGSTLKMGTGINAQQRAIAGHHLDLTWTPAGLAQRNGRPQRPGNYVAKVFNNNEVEIHYYLTENTLDSYMLTLVKNKQFFINQMKKRNLSVRTLDEGAMDENGNIPFNEWIALLQGNTDLLEVAKLEKKIAVLENDYHTYSKNHRKYEKRLKEKQEELTEKSTILQGLEKDWHFINEHLPYNDQGHRPNPVRLSGLEDMDLKAIGEHLARMAKETYTAGEDKKIGTLLKFDLIIRSFVPVNGRRPEEIDNRFYVRGALDYYYNSGIMAKQPMLAATNFIKAIDVIPYWIEPRAKEISQLQQDIRTLQKNVGVPWKKEEELKQLKKEKADLDRKINLSIQQKEQGVQQVEPVKEVKPTDGKPTVKMKM